MHILGYYKQFNELTHFSLFMNSFCNTGVTLFILISGFYGIKYIKWDKFFSLFNITTFYSIFALLFIYDIASLSKFDIIKNLFPVFCNKYWFVTSYLILMLLSGYIEKTLHNLTKKQMKLLILYLCIFVIFSPSLFLLEIFNDSGKGFMNMLTTYLIGRYIYIYGWPHHIANHYKILIPTLTILIWGLNEILSLLNLQPYFCRDNNVLILILALSIFYWVINMKPLMNYTLNQLSSYVFPIYIIHTIFLPIICKQLYNTQIPYIFQFIIGCISLFFISIFIDYLRILLFGKTLKRIESKQVEWVNNSIA